MAAWELPACLSQYGAEGHVSNDGEDLLKRLWDLFSEIGSDAFKSISEDFNKIVPPDAPTKPFDRTNVTASDLKSSWEQQNAMSTAISGAHTKYNLPSDHPANYIPKRRDLDVDVDEAMFDMKTMLFDYTKPDMIIDFISQVHGVDLILSERGGSEKSADSHVFLRRSSSSRRSTRSRWLTQCVSFWRPLETEASLIGCGASSTRRPGTRFQAEGPSWSRSLCSSSCLGCRPRGAPASDRRCGGMATGTLPGRRCVCACVCVCDCFYVRCDSVV